MLPSRSNRIWKDTANILLLSPEYHPGSELINLQSPKRTERSVQDGNNRRLYTPFFLPQMEIKMIKSNKTVEERIGSIAWEPQLVDVTAEQASTALPPPETLGLNCSSLRRLESPLFSPSPFPTPRHSIPSLRVC